MLSLFFSLRHNLLTLVFIFRFRSVSCVETGNSVFWSLYLFLIQTVRLGHISSQDLSVCSKLETTADPGLRHGPQAH